MRNFKLNRAVMACILAFAMVFGTCAASFAEINPEAFVDEAKANAEVVIDEIKAIVDGIVEAAKDSTAEEQKAKIDAKAAEIEAKLAEYGIAAGPKTDEFIAIADAKLDEIIEFAYSGADVEAIVADYISLVSDYLATEYGDVIETVKGEVEDIIADGEVEKEEIEAAVNEYVEITEEQKAKINEAIAQITEIVATVKDYSPEEIKAYIAELQAKAVAKLGHKKYAADDDSYYVALGGDTVTALGIAEGKEYYNVLAKELKVENEKVAKVAKNGMYPSQIPALVEDSADEIENADIITYQLDAISFINATLKDIPAWNKYIDDEITKLLDEILETALNVDWSDYVEDKTTYVAAIVKEKVTSDAVKEYIVISEEALDTLIEEVVGYVVDIASFVEEKAAPAVDVLKNETIRPWIKKLVYSVVVYAVETVNAIEKIQEINPEAALYVVGMYNPVRGLKIDFNGTVIDAEEIFDYVIAATNLYYAGLAAADGEFAFVDVSGAKTNGFTEDDKIVITAGSDFSSIVSKFMGIVDTTSIEKTNANAVGHAYIADQIFAATKCVDGTYEKLNGTYHNVLCALCGEFIRKEKHTFEDKVCTLCRYEKTSSGKGGSSGGGSTTIKKEETSSVSKFTDVSKDAWYYDVIKKIVEKGLMNGMSDTSFAPDLEVTRAMFVTILYRAAGEPKIEATSKFADVAADQYYANAVAWAAANGIVNGVSEIEFAPNNDITREQMATILYRYNKKAAETAEVAYADKDSISEYAMEAVAWAKAAGIMQGNADGTFAPVRNASRAEAAAVFVRLLGL